MQLPIHLLKDEWYPVYSFYRKVEDENGPDWFGDSLTCKAELSDVVRWKKLFIEFKDMQKELRKLYEEQHNLEWKY